MLNAFALSPLIDTYILLDSSQCSTMQLHKISACFRILKISTKNCFFTIYIFSSIFCNFWNVNFEINKSITNTGWLLPQLISPQIPTNSISLNLRVFFYLSWPIFWIPLGYQSRRCSVKRLAKSQALII